ncbi:hypothetical protein ACTIVE_6065 [Actinomadura verrucosospora]|uniref:Inositolphosphotransferase Aur1/Ipt1 domain-containing protein n=2 Tax=Actinomadura verrucosospora TaxID=46165 RepID=A0A7D3VWH4_ACTVE|nr:hypothetical protein ACTIVE_6065 [Actinomadura verrucosospora]
MHTGFTMGILLLCYLAGPGVYRPARNALVLTNLAGLVVFFVLPVMPPRLLPDAGFIDSVALAGFGTVHSPGGVEADQFAAMPSLHMGWAVWVAVVIMALIPRHRVRWLAMLHPIVTAIVVVVTANHYVLDVIAGVAVSGAALFGTGLVWAGNGTTYAAGQLIKRNRPAPVPAPADVVDPAEVADAVNAADPADVVDPVDMIDTVNAADVADAVDAEPAGITKADPDKGHELASP